MVRRKSLARAIGVLAIGGVLAASFAISPSFGAATLTKAKATKIATKTFKKITDVAATSSGAIVNATGNTPTNVPGATLTLTNGGKTNALLTATFSGSSSCGGGGPADACVVVARVDGTVMQPSENAGGFYIFDSESTSGNDVNESHAVTFHATVSPGPHTVQIQYYHSNAAGSFSLRGWSLVGELAPA